MESMKTNSLRIINDSLLIGLALVSVGLLVFEITADLTPETLSLIRVIDLGTAFVFGLEFFVRLYQARTRKHFLKNNWWHILAALPVTASGTQALRGLMLIRLYRIMQFSSVVARFSLFSKSLNRILKETHMVWIASVFAIVLALGSTAFYYFEHIVNPHVSNFYDGFWFMAETMTNTGIGEVYPMTSAGRAVGIISMFSGAIIFGLFIAFISSYLVSKKNSQRK